MKDDFNIIALIDALERTQFDIVRVTGVYPKVSEIYSLFMEKRQ